MLIVVVFFCFILSSVRLFPNQFLTSFRHSLFLVFSPSVSPLLPSSLILPPCPFLHTRSLCSEDPPSPSFLLNPFYFPLPLPSDLGRLRRLEGDVRRDPDPSGLLPLSPDLLLAAALPLQKHSQGLVRLVETCRVIFWSVSQ